MNIPILSINSQNIDRIDSLGLYNEDKAIIREAVKSGAYVTVPEKNIKINNWTGTGYIIQNNDTGDLSFKITGAINGAYADVVYIPKSNTALPALVIELKWEETAEAAIDQIKEKRYHSVLEDYFGEIVLVGISYNSKTNEHTCTIEKIVK